MANGFEQGDKEMTVTNEIKKLEHAFEVFNNHFYNGELETPVIQFYADTKEKTRGWVTIQDVWNGSGRKCKELNICANCGDVDMSEIYATLLHEMAHVYNIEHGITDTSSNGYYHNKSFKKTAEEHGLIVTKSKKYGWCESILTQDALDVVLDNFTSRDDLSMHYEVPKKEKKKKKQNSFKHVCPKCGAIARTSKDGMHLICGDCMEVMVQED